MDSPGVAVDAANIVDIVEGLAVPRGGVRVPRPIHLPLATYIVKTLGLESLDEFIAMGAEGAAATLSALDEDYPAPFVTCLRSWVMAPAAKDVKSWPHRPSEKGKGHDDAVKWRGVGMSLGNGNGVVHVMRGFHSRPGGQACCMCLPRVVTCLSWGRWMCLPDAIDNIYDLYGVIPMDSYQQECELTEVDLVSLLLLTISTVAR